MTTSASDTRWHVLQVKPKSEKKVGLRLREMGFESCVPTQKQLRKWSDRKKIVEIVLFNNYVFVATNQLQKNEVFRAGNIYGYLNFGGHAAVLSEKEVALVKRLSNMAEPVQITYEGFHLHEEVEILSGSLVGMRGVVTAIHGGSRIQLALPSLQCFANVEVKGVEVRRIKREN